MSLTSRASPLICLATEVLDEVVTYLPQQSLLQLIVSCRHLQPVAARQLYHTVDVTGPKSRRCFLTLHSSPEATLPYGNYLRCLTYVVTSDEDTRLKYTYALFCRALYQTPGLITLNLRIPSEYGIDLFSKLYHGGIICLRENCVSNGTVLVISDPLPKLSHLRVFGDVYLVELASFRKITTLHIEEINTLDRLQTMIECLTDEFPINSSTTNTSLINLTVGLSFDNPTEIIQCLHEIGKMLAIEYLSIFSDNINALAVTGLLMKEKKIFPQLHHLLVNEATHSYPAFNESPSECLDVQMEHLKNSSLTRPLFSLADFGPVKWTISNGIEWTTTYLKENDRLGSVISLLHATDQEGLLIRYEL